MKDLLTVVIPTKDRAEYFEVSLESVINQNFRDFKLIILDCGENSSLENKLEPFREKIDFVYKKTTSLSIIDGWNQAVTLANSKYISIFHDDDIMLPNFLEQSLLLLEKYSTAGMSYSQANKVDENGKYTCLWSENIINQEYIKGVEYLLNTIKYCCCITIAPTVIMKKEVYKKIGPYKDDLCFNTFDLNYWIKVANHYDIVFNSQPLVNYRIHEGQMSKTYWWEKKAKGRLATMIELKHAVNLLLSEHIKELSPEQIIWLLEKDEEFNKLSVEYAQDLIPGL